MLIDRFTLSGKAVPLDAERMLCDICSHFAEHSEVRRDGDCVKVESVAGQADIRKQDGCLAINLSCPTAQMLQTVRNVIAEHLFMFAGDEPLALDWADQPKPAAPSDLTEVTVVAARNIAPHMRRVTFRCYDLAPFLNGDMHVRLLIPPQGRAPVWPTARPDGRIAWPTGEDVLTVRVYTIRRVDAARGELDIDFVLHESGGRSMPGAEFALRAKPGDRVSLLGPGGGGLPKAKTIILAGDETALPAISRIAENVEADTRLTVFIEVDDVVDEIPLVSRGTLSVTWLHRKGRPAGSAKLLTPAVEAAYAELGRDTYVWAGCERQEARVIRDFLKTRGHDRQAMCVGAYWQSTADCRG